MKTTAEMIEVMRAFERGEEIESCPMYKPDPRMWESHKDPTWAWDMRDYRIKPREPRVIWVNEYKDGDYTEYAVHESQEDAGDHATEGATRTAIKFIEVIE